MNLVKKLVRIFHPVRFTAVEDQLKSTTLLILTAAAFIAFIIAMGIPLFDRDFASFRVAKIVVVVTLLVSSLVFLSKKMVAPASFLLILALVGFVLFQISSEIDGIHDTALFAIPGILVIAGLLLRGWQFFSLTGVILIWIAAVVLLEDAGLKNARFSYPEAVKDGIDIIVIFALTAVGVYFVAHRYIKTFIRAKENEARLRELNLTKDKFFSIVAHDLKSPFNSITGFSELLLKHFREFDDQKIERQLKIIVDSSKNASNLLENLLIWSRSQTGTIEFKPAVNDLCACIRENISLVEHQAALKRIRLNFGYPDAVMAVFDTNMVNTVIRNLLTNAIKFTPHEGSISIRLALTKEMAEVSIADTGVGIEEKNLEKLFRIDGNLTTKGTDNEKGTGLGLILCREFVERNNGVIRAESEVGKGSRFVFSLPRHQEDKTGPQQAGRG